MPFVFLVLLGLLWRVYCSSIRVDSPTQLHAHFPCRTRFEWYSSASCLEWGLLAELNALGMEPWPFLVLVVVGEVARFLQLLPGIVWWLQLVFSWSLSWWLGV